MAQTSGSRYVIPAESFEKKRLGAQYLVKKRMFGWKEAVPSSVDVSQLVQVLDVAAGTCPWSLDLASMPKVRPRLDIPGRDPTTSPIHLCACDINTKFFPDKAITRQFGITTFQHDVTKPFPDEYHSKFDLVHLCFLFLCLTEDEFKAALRNCRQVLKPGGSLMIEEADPILYKDSIPTESDPGHDLEKCLTAPGWLGQANRIYTAFPLRSGFIIDLTFRLPSLLSASGYEVVDTKRVLGPWGKHGHIFQGTADRTLSEHADFPEQNMRVIFEHLAAALLAQGTLEGPGGTSITTKEDMMAMLREVEEGLREEGAFSLVRYCVAKKM